MAEINCSACEDLRQDAPNFVVNGLGDTECTSLQNDTGLNASSGNNDCTDLNNMNDCLIGNMETEVDAYDVCDWKEFMKSFISNVWTVFKGIICSICGIWTNIHQLWTQAERIDCLVDYLYNGVSFTVHEEPSAGSYVVAGKGVSFYQVDQSWTASDVGIAYYGGLGRWTGSLIAHTGTSFQDAKAVPNFDNGSVIRTSTQRLGNPLFGNAGKLEGTELLYEIRLKKSEYPQLRGISGGRGQESTSGSFHATMYVFTEGTYAYGNHGTCEEDGTPSSSGYDSGHLVEAGYIYVQVRLSYLDMAWQDVHQYSPVGWCGIRLKQDSIPC